MDSTRKVAVHSKGYVVATQPRVLVAWDVQAYTKLGSPQDFVIKTFYANLPTNGKLSGLPYGSQVNVAGPLLFGTHLFAAPTPATLVPYPLGNREALTPM